MQTPGRLDFTPEQIEALLDRITNKCLEGEDYSLLTATLPLEGALGSRADSTAKAIVSLLKYRGGLPFYRQGQMQEALRAPISPSEIWEMTEDLDALLDDR